MLYATEDDRIKLMRESIRMTGRQFNTLARFEQQAIASAAGITDNEPGDASIRWH